MKNNLLILFLLLLIFSCKKEAEIIPEIINDSEEIILPHDTVSYNDEYLWRVLVPFSASDVIASASPIFLDDETIIFSKIEGDSFFDSWYVLNAFDTNGNFLWEKYDGLNFNMLKTNSTIKNGNLYFYRNDVIHQIDMNSGAILNQLDLCDCIPEMIECNYVNRWVETDIGYLISGLVKNASDKVSSVVLKFDPTNMNCEEVLRLTDSENSYTDISQAALHINENNESLLFMNGFKSYVNSDNKNIYQYMCYNLTENEMLWRVDDPDNNVGFPLKPLIDENYNAMFVLNHHGVSSIDIENGVRNWNYQYPTFDQVSAITDFISYGNKLIFGSNAGFVTVLNKDDGSIFWQKDTDGYIQGIEIWNNYLVMASNQINFYNLENGRLRFRIDQPLQSFNRFDVAIDSVNGLLYSNDQDYLYCFELPDI